MPEWLSNPWVVSIVAGVISGPLVTLVAQRIFGGASVAERRRRAASTNTEVIHTLRPGIAEGVIPSREVVEALIHSTARRNDVDSKYVYDCPTIGEELIKEVMDSSFISAQQKADYCDALRALVALSLLPQFPSGGSGTSSPNPTQPVVAATNVPEKQTGVVSRSLGAIAALITASLGFFASYAAKKSDTSIDLWFLVIPSVAIILVTAATAFVNFAESHLLHGADLEVLRIRSKSVAEIANAPDSKKG